MKLWGWVLLGIAALAGIGAAVYYFFIRGGGLASSKSNQVSSGSGKNTKDTIVNTGVAILGDILKNKINDWV
jgi:hypothetical protein